MAYQLARRGGIRENSEGSPAGRNSHEFRYVAAALLLALPAGLMAPAHRAAAEEPRHWAVLIGAEKYQDPRVPPLRYTANDVEKLAATLLVRGGFEREQILQITDGRTDAAQRPTREALMAQLVDWLKKPGPEDTMLLYFSGHGDRDAEGRLYLIPVDCNPDDLAATAISVEWFRARLAACRAGFKLLVLDACHAGSEKAAGQRPGVSADELGASFKELERVVTLASSEANEKSLIWDDKQQSLFSYYLNLGLKGHADENANGVVDVGELYNFVSPSVKHTALERFKRDQTPRRIIHAAIDGNPDVLTLRPEPLKSLLADIAEQIGDALDERRLASVGVLEFTVDNGLEELLGNDLDGPGKTDFGLLGKNCADELERRLIDLAARRYSVVDRDKLKRAMGEQRFSLASLSSTPELKSLSKGVGGMPVIAKGTLHAPETFGSRDRRLVRLTCKLVQTASDAELGVKVGGTAALTVNEWGMFGRSVVVRAEDQRPEPTIAGQRPRPLSAQTIERLEARAGGPDSHPFKDPTFEFSIQMMINGKAAQAVFRGNDYFVAVRKGDTYQLKVENRRGQPVMMRLLVDGLNTLPEKETNAKGLITESWGRHVSLNEARAWVLDPADPRLPGGKPVWNIEGFATRTGADGETKKFEIVNAAESLAAKRSFTDDIGLIMAAFYVADTGGQRGGPSGLGTAAGHEVNTDLTERKGLKVGNPLGIVHIRYVSEEALRRVK